MNALKSLPPKKAISLVVGLVGVFAGLKDLRKNASSGKLTQIHNLLKITVAVVGVVVALRAAEEIAEDA